MEEKIQKMQIVKGDLQAIDIKNAQYCKELDYDG